MIIETLLAGAVAVFLLVYLAVAFARPEKY